LRDFHALSPPADLALPAYDPFAGLDHSIDASPVINDSERQWLTRHVHRLRAQYRETTSRKVLHGDAWQGNVAVTASGEAILLDLEHVSLGRQHWDLVQIAADYTDFARITEHEYRSFVDEYGGFDVTRHGDYRTLADIAELRWTCFAIRKAATNTQAVREAHHRIACLQAHHPRPWTWNAL
jgi:thiamine kinase-like enzyme